MSMKSNSVRVLGGFIHFPASAALRSWKDCGRLAASSDALRSQLRKAAGQSLRAALNVWSRNFASSRPKSARNRQGIA